MAESTGISEKASARRLILCLDGTNNEYRAINTNVVKLYAMIDRSQDDQLTYYQPGIGTFAPPGVWGAARKWLVTRLDLAIGWLLEEHVSDAYRFLMRYYRPGDEIFIFGFSRGAYTARVLAGMLHKVGLLTPGNEELIPFAWKEYRSERDSQVSGGFRTTFSRVVDVDFLGLWDTVSSIGWLLGLLWVPEHFPHTLHNPSVKTVRHAVALDERRCYFVQNLWGQPQAVQDVQQVWFPGVHCDIGGGYREKEAGLSKIALGWMVYHAKTARLRLDPSLESFWIPSTNQQAPDGTTVMSAAPDPAAMKHESLRGLWWILEYIPRRIRDPARNFGSRWVPFHGGRPRYVGDGAHIHETVFQRKSIVSVNYDPKNLPANYVVVSTGNAC